MKRRHLLRSAVAAGVVGFTGCQGVDGGDSQGTRRTPTSIQPTREPPTETPDSSPSVVDTSRMTEVQADVSAGDEVSDVVETIDDGDLVVFPPGRFSWESPVYVTTDNWGIRCHSDTVFEVPAGLGDGEEADLLETHSGDDTADNFLLENLTFDSPGRAAPGLHLGVRNNAHVDGLHYRMNGPTSNQWQENGLRAYVVNSDGILQIDDYRQHNNGDLGGYAAGDSRVAIFVAPKNEGTVHLREPVLQGFPNNACYVSRQPGTVIVEGGLLTNNNVSAVRVSGGVEVRDTTISIDIDSYLDGPGVLETPDHNTRGVWGDNRGAGTDGGLVTGTSFVVHSYRRSYGLATILENPKMTIRNSQFLVATDMDAVQAEAGEIAVENCDFTGLSSGATAGVGNITGSGNCVAVIDPGDVPVVEQPGVCLSRMRSFELE